MFGLKRPIRDDAETWAYEYENERVLRRLLAGREADDYIQTLAMLAEPEPTVPAADAVTQYFAERLQQLGRRIEGLKEELRVRRDLRGNALGEIDYQIGLAAHSLREFEFWGIGYNRGVDMKRGLLERQLADFRHKRRQEQHAFWRDVVALRKELREAIAEYEGALRRLRLIEGG
jgi:hypothetical protein